MGNFTAYQTIAFHAAKVASQNPAFVQEARKAKQLVDTEVNRMYTEAKGTATGRYKSSIGISRITTGRGVKDILIYTNDPQAHIIEWGHVRKDGTWEPGKFVFTRALMKGRFGG